MLNNINKNKISILFYLFQHRTIEDSVYNLAVQLAKRYKIDIWDVYMTHVEYLFEESE